MQRTNIFLTEEQQRRLERRAGEEGVSKSSLIRRIVDEALGITRISETPENAIRASAGIWSDRSYADLDDVLRWREEVPLERLHR
jgi:hypothetical protein